jgi:hypothetical protein
MSTIYGYPVRLIADVDGQSVDLTPAIKFAFGDDPMAIDPVKASQLLDESKRTAPLAQAIAKLGDRVSRLELEQKR